MSDELLNALSGEPIYHSNPLATVTANCLVVRNALQNARVILPVEQITAVQKVITTNPPLLVISSGFFTIAAASYASKQGSEITYVLATLGVLFVIAYLMTRRAAVLILLPDERIETEKGTPREANLLIQAVVKLCGESCRLLVPVNRNTSPIRYIHPRQSTIQ